MTDAQKYVWEGAIPLQIHLHESEVTTLPPPPPALVFSFLSSSSIAISFNPFRYLIALSVLPM